MQGWLIRLMHALVGRVEGQSQYFDQMRTWLVRGIEAGSNHAETLGIAGRRQNALPLRPHTEFRYAAAPNAKGPNDGG